MTVSKDKHELIEKWFLLSALHGINMSQLWDSNRDGAYEVLHHMEVLEEHNQLIKEAEGRVYHKIVMEALNLGLSTEDLSEYSQVKRDIREAEERARLKAEEEANPLLNKLKNEYQMALTDGPSPNQRYWKFTADLGDSLIEYKCRMVHYSWLRKAIWREWKDSNGKKQRDKFEFGSYRTFPMDKEWPENWQQNYNRVFGEAQLPFAYTRMVIDNYKLSIKRTRKRKPKVGAV